MALTRYEFDVELPDIASADIVRNAIQQLDSIQKIEIDLKGQRVLVESSIPSSTIQEIIEMTDRKAVLKGLGPAANDQFFGAAVVALNSPSGITGIVRFLQMDEDCRCLIDGTIDGLTPGEHGLHIYEYGDLSNGCLTLGCHYNPTNRIHGGPSDKERHVGDLGNVKADENGRAVFRLENDALKVADIIGRSLGVTENGDDYGAGQNEDSKMNGNSGECLAFGIIARSAGLFQNPKRLCQCSGRTVWDEREEAVKIMRNSKM